MKNEALLFLIKKLNNSILDDTKKASDMIKEATDIEALMDAKKIDQDSVDYYRNLKDIFVKVDFGNNVVLPFYIDNNIATCLKVTQPKEEQSYRLKSKTALIELFGLKKKATTEEIRDHIKEIYGEELKIEETPSNSFNSNRKTSVEDALKTTSGSVWEASLKRFIGEVEKTNGQPEVLASDADSLKRIKKISSILSMMENKQKAIIEKKGIEENNFISIQNSTRKDFNEEQVENFLKKLEKENTVAFHDLMQNKKVDPTVKMMGIYHLDELIELSPNLKSLLDMELNNKVNYKISKLNEEEDKVDKSEEILITNGSNALFSDFDYTQDEVDELSEELDFDDSLMRL